MSATRIRDRAAPASRRPFNWYLRGGDVARSRVMDSLLPILTALAATDAPAADRSKQTGGYTDFPAEEPSEKELSDWLEDNVTTVRKTRSCEVSCGVRFPSRHRGGC